MSAMEDAARPWTLPTPPSSTASPSTQDSPSLKRKREISSPAPVLFARGDEDENCDGALRRKRRHTTGTRRSSRPRSHVKVPDEPLAENGHTRMVFDADSLPPRPCSPVERTNDLSFWSKVYGQYRKSTREKLALRRMHQHLRKQKYGEKIATVFSPGSTPDELKTAYCDLQKKYTQQWEEASWESASEEGT